MSPIIHKTKDYIVVYDQTGKYTKPIKDSPRLVYNDLDLTKFPHLTNDKVLARLNKGESLTKIVLDEIDRQTGGAFNISAIWKGPREGPSPAMRKFMQEHGDEVITDLTLHKQPLSNYLTRILDTVSLGNWTKTKERLGYKTVNHVGLNVITNKGSYLIEKNAVVEAKDLKEDAVKAGVDIDAKIPVNLTIRAMIDSASKDDPDFWRYRGRDKNCQVLVQDLLDRNNIDHNDEAALQDTRQLVDSLGPAQVIVNPITDTAATIDRVVNGEGLKKRKGLGIRRGGSIYLKL